MEENQEVYISAASNSRKFDKVNDAMNTSERGITGYEIVATLDDGRKIKDSLGTYAKQKFPGSRQSLLPIFDEDARRFKIRKADGTYWSQDDINNAVTELKLKYPSYHPFANQVIKESSLTDYGDSFINHQTFRLLLAEGEATLKPHDPRDKFVEDAMRGSRGFMEESLDNIRSGDVEYVIRNPAMADAREDKVREEKEEAFEYYSGMSSDPVRMRQILLMFGEDVDENATSKTLRNRVFKKMDDAVGRDRGEVNQKLFIRFAKLPPEVLELQSTVMLANSRKLILDRAGIYEFEGTSLGTTFEGACDFFRRPENSASYQAIKIRLGLDKA